jgi:TonB C terminal
VKSIYLIENRVGELALSEVASGTYIAHMAILSLLFVYVSCFFVPLQKVPQILDIQFASDELTMNSAVNSEQNLPEKAQPILPLSRPLRYEQDFARVFDGVEKTAAIKSAQQSAVAKSEPRRINSAESALLPLPMPKPAPIAPSLSSFPPPSPQPLVRIALAQPLSPLPRPLPIRSAAAASQACGQGLSPAPVLPHNVESTVLPVPALTLRTEPPQPINPESIRVDELVDCRSARLLSQLSGNDMNESVPFPVVPLMGFTGSKEAIVGPMPVALSSQPQTGSLFAVRPAVPAFPAEAVTFHHGECVSEPAVDITPTLRYMQDLERRIKRKWFPHTCQSRRVVVCFKLHRNGELTDLRLARLPGNSESIMAANAALKAVTDAAPFAPLPPDTELAEVDVQFTFDWNSFNGVGTGIELGPIRSF